jgi:Fe-S-cluster-containing hydrogenase component 2
VCARNCPVAAITGERKQLHVIDQDLCIKCGICHQVCAFDAINVI